MSAQIFAFKCLHFNFEYWIDSVWFIDTISKDWGFSPNCRLWFQLRAYANPGDCKWWFKLLGSYHPPGRPGLIFWPPASAGMCMHLGRRMNQKMDCLTLPFSSFSNFVKLYEREPGSILVPWHYSSVGRQVYRILGMIVFVFKDLFNFI